MAVHSINVNRVSNTLRTDALLATLRRSTLDLFKEQNRISTGRQFLAPSEDPGRAARALNLSEILDQQDQLLVNIRHGGNVLDATDQAMAEASSLVIDAQSVASQNIGTLSSDDEREAAAEVVASIREQLVAVGNRTFEGRLPVRRAQDRHSAVRVGPGRDRIPRRRRQHLRPHRRGRARGDQPGRRRDLRRAVQQRARLRRSQSAVDA
jgi:hypothetical protein